MRIKLSLVLLAVGVALFFMTARSDAQRYEGQERKNGNSGKGGKGGQNVPESERQTEAHAQKMLEEGKQTFRFDTFGDEAFWSDALQLHLAIAGAKLGGVGPGVSPRTALSVGLKVDVDALPEKLISELRKGRVSLDDPATTLALLKLDAVLGLKGTFNGDGSLQAVGVSCALCHSVVDNSFAPGIGRRLDGWANRDLDVGAITALSPNLSPVTALLGVDDATVRKVLQSWGPGKFDAELFLDGKAFRPDGKSAATLIPPAFGLAGVNLHTWTGWGSVTHWNAFVASLEMHGQGTFYDPRLNDPVKFPIAAREGFGNVRSDPDLITPKLPALQFYQLAIPAPAPPDGSFDRAAATRGKALFNNQAKCSTCHVPPIYTEPGWNMHTAEEIGIDDFQAKRSPDERYRTAPLNGLWTHQKGGFYHDGRFATLLDVVEHYDRFFGTNLNARQREDLVEYLKSL
jgi:mono/diheme cytochrome c family protein